METLSRLVAFAITLSFSATPSFAQYGNCDFYQQILPGQQFNIHNEKYPNNYRPSSTCRWLVQGPPGTRIFMSCDVIDIPQSPDCQNDRLAVSLGGNLNLEDARNYCGKGTLTLTSDGNALVVALYAASTTVGGKFACSVTAIQGGGTTTTTTPIPPTCDCGWTQGRRIVGGHETGVNEYPYMAALAHIQEERIYCGATILSKRYALTAAHCYESRQFTEFALLVGDHNPKTGADTSHSAVLAIERVIIHEQYNFDTLNNDIAIVKTVQPIAFSLYVGPICLPFRYSTSTFAGANVKVMGWGDLEFTGTRPEALQEVDLTVVSNQYCAQNVTDRPVTAAQICTYAPEKDACSGDSGGPVAWRDGSVNRMFQVGVISFGRGCGLPTPGVNTRVTYYLSWIISKTGDASYCIK